jgi:hypothetical protein
MKRALSSTVLAASLFAAFPAQAYCIARACDEDDPDAQCTYDRFGCPLTESRPALFWPSKCVTFGVNSAGSPKYEIDYDLANEAAELAASRWIGADCGGATPGVNLVNIGPIACGEVEYNQTGNANVVLFTDEEWPFGDDRRTIALTIIQFSTETGEIYDADIAINSANMPFESPNHEGGLDLSSVLTHEMGHFLGLGHSSEPTSVMAPSYADTDTGELRQDDIDGICSIHPPDDSALEADCAPRHGLSKRCGGRVPTASGGCTFTRRPVGEAPGWVALAGLVFARRRAGRRAPRSR